MSHRKPNARRWRGAPIALALGLSTGLVACDSLLEVDLPSQLTDEALDDPASAETQVTSAIAHFECGYSTWAYFIAGDEDSMDPQGAVYYASGAHVFQTGTETGNCDANAQSTGHYTEWVVSRKMAADVYGRLTSDWAGVANAQQLAAIAALYVAANVEIFGELFCEMAIDGGPLLTPSATLDEANAWVQRSLDIIGTIGDFEMPHGITPGPGGAQALAHALRSRILWAQGDLSGAATAGALVPEGFVAHATRGGGLQRRNKVYQQGTSSGYSAVAPVNDWWSGDPNPATGQPWPAVIPFTGYVDLGILPTDGRAVWDDNGLPVRLAGSYLKPEDAAAIMDTRVTHFTKSLQGGSTGEVPNKYTGDEDPIPFVNWEEIWLIRAEAAGGQTAIDLVNDIRAAHGLPLVTYADPSDATQIRYMIIEEKRRSLWLEGRYIMTKIQNTDLLWFPRAQGATLSQGAQYFGGVRRLMPNNEYELNPNLTLDDRATGCAPAEAPVLF